MASIDILDLIADGEFVRRAGNTLDGDGIDELAADVANNAAAQTVLDARYGPGGTLGNAPAADPVLTGDVDASGAASVVVPDAVAGTHALNRQTADARFGDTVRYALPSEFVARVGTPARNATGIAGIDTWVFDAAATEQIIGWFRLPAWCATFDVTFVWTNTAATTGDVVWEFNLYSVAADGAALAGSVIDTNQATLAAPATAGLRTDWAAASGLTAPANKIVRLQVVRTGGNAADTLANDAAFVFAEFDCHPS